MKLTIKFILTLFIVFFYTDLFSQKTLELKNSNLEGLSPEGKFWWWNNITRKGADATFSVEDFDTNPGSQRAHLTIEPSNRSRIRTPARRSPQAFSGASI